MLKKIYASFKNFIIINYRELIVFALISFAMLYNFPYYIYKPGGAINLNDRIKIDNDYKTMGSYNMNYVSVSKGNLPNLIVAYFNSKWDIKKKEDITYDYTDYQTTFRIEQLDLKNSIDIATLLAYNKAGFDVTMNSEEGNVIYIDEDAKTDLKLLDKIISIDGNTYKNLSTLKEYINTLNVGDKVNIKVSNNGKEYDRYAYIYDVKGSKVMGVLLLNSYDYDTNPKLSVVTRTSEAGSSGGLMLTLAIYDGLLKEDLSRGRTIMGTGTIDIEGNVGEIGGIKHKMLGAEKNGADVFFVPRANYKEAKKVYKKYKMKFSLVVVDTFDDATNYLSKK